MRRGYFTLAVLAVLVFAFEPSMAQQRTVKESLIGSWLITDVVDERPGGGRRDSWQGPASGHLTFDISGRFTQIILGPVVGSMRRPDPRVPDRLIVAFFGQYEVDEAAKKVTIKIEGAGHSERVGATQFWNVQGSGDALVLVGSARTDQDGEFVPKLQVKRAGR